MHLHIATFMYTLPWGNSQTTEPCVSSIYSSLCQCAYSANRFLQSHIHKNLPAKCSARLIAPKSWIYSPHKVKILSKALWAHIVSIFSQVMVSVLGKLSPPHIPPWCLSWEGPSCPADHELTVTSLLKAPRAAFLPGCLAACLLACLLACVPACLLGEAAQPRQSTCLPWAIRAAAAAAACAGIDGTVNNVSVWNYSTFFFLYVTWLPLNGKVPLPCTWVSSNHGDAMIDTCSSTLMIMMIIECMTAWLTGSPVSHQRGSNNRRF